MENRRSRFYLILTVALLMLVLLGFGRTFYLRAFFEQPIRWQMDRLPWVYLVHGVVMTAWFALLVVQSALINLHRQAVHRKLGYALAGLAVLVVVTGMLVIFDATPSRVELGLLDPGNLVAIRGHMLPLYLDSLSLIVFTGAISVAILYRTNRVLHRTMVLIGSMAMMAAVLGRLVGLLGPGLSFVQFVVLTLVLMFAAPTALLMHDWIRYKRFPKPAFVGLGVLIAMVGLALVLPGTEIGLQFFLKHLSGWRGVPPV
jgi:hypothetical protein